MGAVDHIVGGRGIRSGVDGRDCFFQCHAAFQLSTLGHKERNDNGHVQRFGRARKTNGFVDERKCGGSDLINTSSFEGGDLFGMIFFGIIGGWCAAHIVGVAARADHATQRHGGFRCVIVFGDVSVKLDASDVDLFKLLRAETDQCSPVAAGAIVQPFVDDAEAVNYCSFDQLAVIAFKAFTPTRVI